MARIVYALEVITGVSDIFYLIVHHGVVSLSSLSVSKALNETLDKISKAWKYSK
jgi:hypothetical protein